MGPVVSNWPLLIATFLFVYHTAFAAEKGSSTAAALEYQQPQNGQKGLASLFEDGKTSYLENDWPACVTNFEVF